MGTSAAVDTAYHSADIDDMMESDAEKFSDASFLHDLCNRESLTTFASDEAVSGTCTALLESEVSNRVPVKLKQCIEKEYVHDIIVDHSMLAEELEKRMMTVAELERCCLAALETVETVAIDKRQHSKGFGSTSGISSASATPKEPRTPGSLARSSRLRLTGESIRKLVKMISPATHRRHHSAELHSSGSSLSGDTPTGSARSISGACDLEFSSMAISETNTSS